MLQSLLIEFLTHHNLDLLGKNPRLPGYRSGFKMGCRNAYDGRVGSGDDLVRGAMHWGYAGSVGQAGAAGGMTSLAGLAEGFRKLS
jgi:hypothetical protein